MTSTTDIQLKDIKLFIGSWNVGNAPPENIHYFLPGAESDKWNYYDLIVVGLQESTYPLASEENEPFVVKKLTTEKSMAGKVFANVANKVEPCIPHLINVIMTTIGQEYELVSCNISNMTLCNFKLSLTYIGVISLAV